METHYKTLSIEELNNIFKNKNINETLDETFKDKDNEESNITESGYIPLSIEKQYLNKIRQMIYNSLEKEKNPDNQLTDEEIEEIIKAIVNGEKLDEKKLPLPLQPTLYERIRKKFDELLKKEFKALYDKGLDFVEPSTITTFYDKEKKDNRINQEITILENASFYQYSLDYLLRQEIRIREESNKPNDVPALKLPKIVVMQIIKNYEKKYNSLKQKTKPLTTKIGNTQLAQTIKNKFNEEDIIDEQYLQMHQPPADLSLYPEKYKPSEKEIEYYKELKAYYDKYHPKTDYPFPFDDYIIENPDIETKVKR